MTALLSTEDPRDALTADEQLLSLVRADGPPLVRWYTVTAPAVVYGLGLRHRLPEVLDVERCQTAGIEVLDRRAGGGLVLLDQHMLCCAICLPVSHPLVTADLTESYRWLGERFAAALHGLGLTGARRVDVAEARADIAQLRGSSDPVDAVLLATCYGALSPHEVALGEAKVVGLAQVRRRDAALFQVGALLRDQAPLADLLRVSDDRTRERLRAALRQRTAAVQVQPEALVRELRESLLRQPTQRPERGG